MAISQGQPEPIDRRRLFLSVGWTLLIFVLCLFLPAGTWAWSRGWLFFFVIVVTSILITLYLRRVNPDVIAGRVNRHEGTKRWDRLLLGDSDPGDVWRSRSWQPWTTGGITGPTCPGGSACWAMPC